MVIKAIPAESHKGVYKFVVKQDVVFENTGIDVEFHDASAFIDIDEHGTITVKGSHLNGYAWDGCTPKVNIFDLWLVGVPDGREVVTTQKPITFYASMVHDALCQYREAIGLTRRQADRVFLKYLGGFKLRYVYYGFVRAHSLMKDLRELFT